MTKTTETVPCPTCKGSGNRPGEEWLACGDCLGMGHIDVNAPAPAHEPPPAIDEPPGRELV